MSHVGIVLGHHCVFEKATYVCRYRVSWYAVLIYVSPWNILVHPIRCTSCRPGVIEEGSTGYTSSLFQQQSSIQMNVHLVNRP